MVRVGNNSEQSRNGTNVKQSINYYSDPDLSTISRRIRACDYLVVAQLFLQNNFLLKKPLTSDDVKPRLLGHWGTCHGINTVYANLKYFFDHNGDQNHPSNSNSSNNPGNSTSHQSGTLAEDIHFVLGPGHGFPALQANLFFDGDLEKVDPRATRDKKGLVYLCRSFSWPGGYPSHASPATPGVICEGGELGYALATAYGAALGCPEQTYCVLIGDGELETATALASLNFNHLLADENNGRVIPILHLNGYKISAPTLYARRSERELHQLLRGFGYDPIEVEDGDPAVFQAVLENSTRRTFLIFRSAKGQGGPTELHGQQITGNFRAHQIPLPHAKTDPAELQALEDWLKSYRFNELGAIK